MKIALIVEKNFQNLHFGVRNFYFGIRHELEKDHIVDFVMYANISGRNYWYRIQSCEKKDRQTDTPLISENNRKITYYSYLELIAKREQVDEYESFHQQFIGCSLKKMGYDACIISNPWLTVGRPEIDVLCYGLFYDFVANKYIFTMKEGKRPIDWANVHQLGYEFYSQHCDYVVADSETIADEYRQYYESPCENKVRAVKPCMPYQYDGLEADWATKSNAIILAAPFDIRKGLYKLPKYLSALEENVDIIYIYGEPRCQTKDFDNFFESFNAKKIVYYPYISYEDLAELYAKSKLLLFPSIQEGLGIPLIEAQINGCRIVTTDDKPMNELGVEGSYFLTSDDLEDEKIIKEMLMEEFDYEGLAKKARRIFSTENIRDAFKELYK